MRANTAAPEAGRTLLGVAPRIALLVGPFLLLAFGLGLLFPGFLAFEGALRGPFLALAVFLAALGLPFLGRAAREILAARRAGILAEKGAYGLCRHPIYGFWIYFALPALAFALDNWLLLAGALALRLVAGRLVAAEEAALAGRFGESHAAYRARVRPFFPCPRWRPLSARRLGKGLLGLVLLGLYALLVFFALVRPLFLGLGATAAERAAPLPGDAFVPAPRSAYTQAIDIDAPPETVWKWLAQVGYRRAGWYNVDAINLLAAKDYFVDGTGSSTRIHPELQAMAVGDKIHLVPGLGLEIAALEPGRLLVLAGDPRDPAAAFNVSWVYRLEPRGSAGTRLLVRFRSAYPRGFLSTFANALVNDVGGAMVQQPAMLRGLKARAEGR
ncbi:MAG: SRPBCC family protein [Spirochaetaceae bacterium]|nr:SRPBCC family protein [Spirochaetaceae bacterium]